MNIKDKILNILSSTGEETASNMALILGRPEPSIRRSIQELIRDGHPISFSEKWSGYYRMAKS